MTQELLSALLDGECSAEELDRILAQIEKDPSLAARYSRMMMAREARAGVIRIADPGFADRVMSALDANPLAPGGSVVPFRPSGWRAYRFLAPAAGLALAAGVGALAVLTLRPEAGAPLPATEVATEVATGGPASGAAIPVSTAGAPESGARYWDQLEPDEVERLNAYLIAYSQSRAQQGMGSTLGYARYAAHTAEYRPQRIQGPSARPANASETPR